MTGANGADGVKAPRVGKNQCRSCAVKNDVLDKFLRRAVVGGSGVGLCQDGEVAAMRMTHER